MLSFSARRVGVIAVPALLGAFVLASCGDADGAATVSTIELSEGSTAFVVRPPATTEPDVVADGAVISTEQEYVIQAGDYPLGVAQQFGVSLDDLVAYNEWPSASQAPFYPGNTIKIPPGGTSAQSVSAGGTDTSETDAGETDTGESATGDEDSAATIPDAGDNCGEGEHTVVDGDYPLGIAEQYDVTIDALDAANAGNPAYGQFVPGQTIIIPAKPDC